MKTENNTNNTNGGIGFLSALTLIFITLKLVNVIQWSWVWVLAPLWIPCVAILLVILIIFIVAFIENM